ncbi:MAG: hypothetical protein KTR30_32465, partial [Saprospiraceae bacterium]|nr:hypothetical protein [Saprospiraceae bacterium]
MDRDKYLKRLNARNNEKELDDFTKKSLDGYQYLPEHLSADALLDKIDRKIDQQTGSKKPAIRRKLPFLLSIAASICLLLYVGLGFMADATPADNEDLFQAYHSPLAVAIPNKGIKRDLMAKETQDYISEAFRLYESGSFDAANELFHRVERAGASSPEILFYHGLSLLAAGRTASAIKKLSPLKKDLTDPAYAENLSWYLALAYVKTEDFEQAKPLLES